MPDPNDLMQQQQQAAPVVVQIQQQEEPIQTAQTLREHLTSLQNWNVGEGQTLEQRRSEHAGQMIQTQREYCERLQNRMREQLAPAQANQAAPGQPQQVAAPKETYKQRKERERRLKEARRNNPAADHLSYNAVQSLQQLKTGQDNAMNTPGIYDQATANKVDKRVLRSFCHGYQTNKRGEPLTPQDQARKQADEIFLRDYVSADLQRRKPHLDRMVNELLNVKLTDEMFTDEYLCTHTIEMKSLIDRMVYFENITKDPVNAPYFEQMDPLKRRLIDVRILNRYAALGQGAVTLMGAKGVMLDHAAYVNGDAAPYIRNAPIMRQIIAQTLTQTTQDEQAAVEETLNAKMAEEEAILTRQAEAMKAEAETMEGDIGGLNLTSFVTGYSFDELSKYRSMIESHPEQYAAHQPVVDALYQEFYRSMDSMGDLLRKSMAVQGVIDVHRDSAEPHDKLLVRAASARQDTLAEDTQLLRNQLSSLADAMQYLLRGKDMSNPAVELLDRMGFQDVVTDYRLKKAFTGPDGAIAKSNEAMKKSQDNGDEPSVVRSQTLQALGIRTSSSEQAQADKRKRGETYTQLPKDIAAHFHDLENNGVDLSAVAGEITEDTKKMIPNSAAAYVSSPGMDPINAALLEKYSQYVNSEASIKYLKDMTSLLKDADIFGGSEEETLEYLSQCLLNSYGANFVEVSKQKETYQKGDDAFMVSRESCRTLLALPSLIRLSDEEQAGLTEGTKQLMDSYKALLRNLMEKIRNAA